MIATNEKQNQVVRVSLNSCVTCSTRKKKCDRILPKCTSCLMRGDKCSYNSKRRRCFGCTKSKCRCSKEFPKCQRCVLRGIECKYPSHGETKEKKHFKSYCSGTKQVSAVQSLKRKKEQLNSNAKRSSYKDYSNGCKWVKQNSGLGLASPYVKKNLDDKFGGDILRFKMLPYTFPLSKAPPNSVFQTDCSIEKANEYYGKLMNKPDEPEFCYQMEENQHQFQAQNFFSSANPKQVLSVPSLKMKKEILDAQETECLPSYLSPFDQTRACSLIQIINRGSEPSSGCKAYLKNEQARSVHQQDVGGELTDSHFKKTTGDKCSGEALSSVIKTPHCTYPLYKAPLNLVFQTDNCKQQQATKKNSGSQEFSMENSSIRRASSDLNSSEGATSVQQFSSAKMNGNGIVILPPKSPSPSYTRFPPENNMIGSKGNLFLATFIRRYTSWHNFLVDLDGIQKVMNRVFFSGPQGIKSLYELPTDRSITLHEMNDRARHAGILAAVGLGSIQLWFLDQEMHKSCYNQIWQLLECCAEQATEEVIFAHGVAALYCRLCHNTTGFLRHIQFFNRLVEKCGTQLEGRIRSFHSYFSLWGSLDSNQIECDKSTWQLIAKEAVFCNFEQDFPLMHNAMLQAPNNLSAQQQQIVRDHLRHIPSQSLHVLTLPTVSWVRRLLINEHASDDSKAEALQEVLKFLGSASKFYHPKGQFAPALKCYLLSTHSFLLLLAGKCSEAKEVLGKQVQMYNDDPLLCVTLLSTNMVHQAHFLCMALSTLEMYESYSMFQRKVNAMAGVLGLPHLPIQPPISNHGLCDEPECMLLWNRLTIPGVPKYSKEFLDPELWQFDA